MTDDGRFWVGPPNAPDTYQLVTCLGGGAEGEVWTAVLPLSAEGRRNVAVKILPPGGPGDDEEAWIRHGHLLRSISHPGLVRVLEVFTGAPKHRAGTASGGTARYVVMDLIEGTTLREWLDETLDATVSQRLRALTTVAAALDEMHSGAQTAVPVAHGDVKPSNIVMRADGSTVLVDLGLTRLTDGAGRVGRSRPYAAPELFAPGARTTPEADRFAFVATLVHAILGEPPPVSDRGPDLDAVSARLQANPLTARRPILIRQVVEALSVPPEQRPQNLRGWLASLTDTLSQVTESGTGGGLWMPAAAPLDQTTPAGYQTAPLPRPAPAGSPLDPADQPARRKRNRLVAVVAAVVVLVLAAGGTAVWALTRDNSATPTNLTGGDGANATTASPASSPTPTQPNPTDSPSSTPTPSDSAGLIDLSPSANPSFPGYTGASPGVTITSDDAPDGFIAAHEGLDTESNVEINGQLELTAFRTEWCCEGTTTEQGYVDLNFGRAYKQFTARFGIDDLSQANQPVRFQVYADNRLLYDKSMALGQSDDVALDVTGVLRMRIQVTGPLYVAHAAIGQPTVFY